MLPRRSASAWTIFTLFPVFALLASAQAPPQPPGAPPLVPPGLADRAARQGSARVLVELRLPQGRHVPEARLSTPAAVAAQRQAIAAAAARLVSRLSPAGPRVLRRYQSVPYVALALSPAAISILEGSAADVVRVTEDRILRPVLADSVPFIQADQAWESGYDGAGTAIAVLDSGVDAGHPFLSGRVVAEACYSSTVEGTSVTLCPNGLDEQIGPGSAAPCPRSDCIHGTHVAGIAAGNGDAAGQVFSGVAKQANLVAVQVFSDVIDPTPCGGTAPCMGAFTSDVIAGLEHVYSLALAGGINLASVNMSLGGGAYPGYCDTEPYKPAIDNLRAIGIGSIVASGNALDTFNISSPACVSSAVSVGSATPGDKVSFFSNVSPILSLLAPGDGIVSSVPVGTYQAASGTSMAAPHVAGAWALIRQGAPAASVSAILEAFTTTGVPVTDDRFWAPGTTTVPRVKVFEALATLAPVTSPVPSISDVSPDEARAGAPLALAITGSGFNALSVVRWNGAPVPTTALSRSQLSAVVPADALAAGTSYVSAFNPAPGGGTSAELPVVIHPPAILSVESTTVAPGSTVTVTLQNGYGNAKDWIGLAESGAADRSYLQWTYVGAGVTTRAWTVTFPSTAGQYEFRLFLNNGYTRVATSPAISVDPSLNPAPIVTSMTPTAGVVGGPAFTLTVNGGSFVPASVVRWNGADRLTTFVSASQLRASIPASDLAAAGTAQVTVFTPAPGGGTSLSLGFSINPPPSLTVSATSVSPGQSVTVTLTGGPGGATDWLALAKTSASNNSYIKWTYVGSGVTIRDWTVTMPTTLGTYEFRLFVNNGYTRIATSPTVTVEPPPPPVPTLTSVSPAGVTAGGPAFALTAGGSGFVTASVVRWNGADRPTTFVSSTQLRAAIPSSDIETVGSAQVTVFTPAPGGGVSNPAMVAINPPPLLTLDAASVAGGGSATVTLTGGPGGGADWLALAPAGAGDRTYLQWTYVGAGVTDRTWTVTAPTTPGVYEFRLFLNNGYTRAATSPLLTVTAPPPPMLTVDTDTAPPGGTATVTLTGGAGGGTDWLALASTSAPNNSYLQWVYVGAGVTTRTWTVTMPVAEGQYEFRLFLNNGYTRAATSPAVNVIDSPSQ